MRAAMTPRFDLAVIGNVVADVLLHPVTRWPEPGLAAPVDSIRMLPGGCAFHTAATAARLGLSVALLGALGDDAPGALVRDAVRARGLGDDALQTVRRARTTITVVCTAPDGERSFLITHGAAARFRVDAHARAVLARARHVHLAGWSLLPGVMGAAGARLLAAARRRGQGTSLDTAWKDGVDFRTQLDPLLPHLDVVMPSLEEAEAASGRRGADACARWFRARGVRTVLITRGREGALLVDEAGRIEQPAFAVDVVDTTGAGDAFAAGWLASRGTRSDRLAFASACGALACTDLGGEAGPKNAAAVRSLMGRVR
jgi:sugar/nucleoside kinase (ribokinase family)